MVGMGDINDKTGFRSPRNGMTVPLWQRILNDLELLDVIFVVAAGNDGENGHSLDEFVPQQLGTQQNSLITVGGVYSNGVLDTITTFDKGEGGSISVYALSRNVMVADFRNNAGSIIGNPGTSLAAPAVAGLAAYYASLPSLNNEWRRFHVALDMKRYIITHAYQRSANAIPNNLPDNYVATPGSITVAYNQAPDGLCAAHLQTIPGSQSGSDDSIQKRQASAKDIDVVVSGTIIVPSLSQSYCYNTSFPTIHPSTTAATTTGAITASPSPTVHIDKGILTCGTRTDDGNGDYWFTLGDAEHAINTFCGNLTNNSTPIVFKPGSDTGKDGVYAPPDNIPGPIQVAAEWTSADDSDCPTTDFGDGDNGAKLQLCQNRLTIAIDNCKWSIVAFMGIR